MRKSKSKAPAIPVDPLADLRFSAKLLKALREDRRNHGIPVLAPLSKHQILLCYIKEIEYYLGRPPPYYKGHPLVEKMRSDAASMHGTLLADGLHSRALDLLMSTDYMREVQEETDLTTDKHRRYRTMEAASMRLQKEAKGYLDSLRGLYT